ncbi:hypothetical protein ACFOGI_07990 [Virgibacillus xinjiangensis]|uniref:Small peptidoglycan-associated lipoprotein n=1 Tax=Virgibacillus xinjiangensis TaxID=393090 RepID=A0ABV7CUU3_9BACI
MSRIRRLLFITVIPLLILSAAGCQSPSAAVEVVSFQPSDYEVLFYTNSEEDTALEDKYKDAIIDVKAKYPEEFADMQAVTKNMNELTGENSAEGPNLVILKNGDPIKHLNGDQPKQKILNQLESLLK